MAKKLALKTGKNTSSVTAYLNSVDNAEFRKDGKALLAFFKRVTGVKPKMWGTSIVGFGEYTYYRANGAEGEFMATGFALRKSGPTLYIMPGYQNYAEIIARLGPHKLGKSCLYLKRLHDIDLAVLETLIRRGLEDLAATHSVRMQ